MISTKTVKTVLMFFLLSPCFSPAVSAVEMQVLGKWDNGPTFDVVVKGNYLYIAAGEQLRIYDISTKDKLLKLTLKQTNVYLPQPDLGTFKEGAPPFKIVHTGGGLIQGMFLDGNYLYVAGDKRFTIVDVSNPEANSSISSLPIKGCRDAKVNGNYAYLVFDGGVDIVDISNKYSPIVIKTISLKLPTNNPPTGLAVGGNYLYVATGYNRGLDVIDVSTPATASIVGNYNASLGNVLYPDYSHVAIKGNYAYAIEHHCGLRVLDVSNPKAPVEVALILGAAKDDYNYNDIKIVGNLAYISERYKGVNIVDISNPLTISTASIVSRLDIKSGYAEGLFPAVLPYGKYTFLSTNSGGVRVIDTTDIKNQKLELNILTPAEGDSIAVKGKYAYIGGHNEGVWVVNISDPANPKEVAMFKNFGRNQGLEIQGNYLYVAGCWRELSVADITDPENPKFLGFGRGAITGPLMAVGDYLYNGQLYQEYDPVTKQYVVLPNGKVIVYDISNKANPPAVLSATDMGIGVAFLSARYGENYLVGGSSIAFYVVDITNRAAPKVAGKYPLNVYGGDVKVAGDIAYVGAGNFLYAFNIKDVKNPSLLGSVPVLMPASVTILGNRAYIFPVSDAYGSRSVDITDPKNMKVVDTLYIGGAGYSGDMVTANGMLYSASGYIISPGPQPPAIFPPTATGITSGKALISWSTNYDADSVVKYGVNSGVYDKQQSLPALMRYHEVLLPGLLPATKYYFVCKSVDASGNVTQTAESSFTTLVLDTVAPSAITNLSVSNVTMTTLILNWTAPGDDGTAGTAAQYDIRYAKAAITESNWATATQVSDEFAPAIYGSDQSYTVTGLTGNTAYYFAAKAADEADNWSAVSNSPKGITLTQDPTDIIISGQSNMQDALLLEYVPDNLIGDYPYLYVGKSYGSYRNHAITRFNINSIPQGKTIVRARLGLKVANVNYNVALNLHGLSAGWDENKVNWNKRNSTTTWVTPGGDFGVVLETENFNADGAVSFDSDALLNTVRAWYAGSSPNNGFLLEADNSALADQTFRMLQSENSGYTANDLFLEVSVIDAVAPTPPAAPLNPQAASGDGKVTLAWSAPDVTGGSPITNYLVYRGTTSGGEAFLIELGNVLTYDNTGLTNGQKYYYKVSAKNGAGEGPQSVEVSTMPNVSNPALDTTSPAQITTLTAGSPTASSMVLSWTPTGDDGNVGTAAQYDIRYANAAITESNWAAAAQVSGEPAPLAAGSAQSYTVNGLSAGTTYYFAIKAADEASNWSAVSNSPKGITLVSPAITVTSPNGGQSYAGGSQQTVTWTSAGAVGNVDISISTNGGTSWATLIANTANDGGQAVIIPNTPSATCRIRVQEPDGLPTDASNSNFTITVVSGYKISGKAQAYKSGFGISGLSGVTLTLSGKASGAYTTGEDGNYEFAGLAGGDYSITPVKSNWRFWPRALKYKGLSGDRSGQNFMGRPLSVRAMINSLVLLPMTLAVTPLSEASSESSAISVLVPEGAFPAATDVILTAIEAPAGDKPAMRVVGYGVSIVSGQNLQPVKALAITMTYDKSQVSGYKEERLVVGRYDELNQRWIALPTTRYPGESKVVGLSDHLSRFALLELLSADDLGGVKAYPNPYNPARHPQGMKLEGLTAGAVVKIYTVTGGLIRELQESGNSGSVAWDGKNESGRVVASGVYIAHIKGAAGVKKIKLAVEK